MAATQDGLSCHAPLVSHHVTIPSLSMSAAPRAPVHGTPEGPGFRTLAGDGLQKHGRLVRLVTPFPCAVQCGQPVQTAPQDAPLGQNLVVLRARRSPADLSPSSCWRPAPHHPRARRRARSRRPGPPRRPHRRLRRSPARISPRVTRPRQRRSSLSQAGLSLSRPSQRAARGSWRWAGRPTLARRSSPPAWTG